MPKCNKKHEEKTRDLAVILIGLKICENSVRSQSGAEMEGISAYNLQQTTRNDSKRHFVVIYCLMDDYIVLFVRPEGYDGEC